MIKINNKIMFNRTKIKKLLLFVFVLFLFSFSNVLAQDLNGKFWINVEDKGKIWYVNPSDNIKYEINTSNAFDIFSQIATLIDSKELSSAKNINKYKGKIILQKQGNIYFYISQNGKKYELNKNNLLNTLKKISTGIKNKDLNPPISISPTITLTPNTSQDPYLDKFISVWNLLKQKYANTIDYDKASQSAIEGMLKSVGDDYTTFFSSASSTTFLEDLDGNFEGIGVEINIKNSFLVVSSVLENTPAEASGILANDVITMIDSKSVNGMTLSEVSKLIRGKAGTDVVLTISRKGIVKEIKVTRGAIHYDSVKMKILDNNIAYIKIRLFNADTDVLMNKIADEILAKNIKGIIVDLRGNPGGYLNSGVNVTGLWVDNNVVLREKTKDKFELSEIKSSAVAKLKNIKTIILVDSGTASASEIFSGALQDYKLATLVGEKTYGKGSVQDFTTLSDGSSVKITIAQWFTPLGRVIDKIGIIPDIEIINDLNSNVDLQLNKAIELLIKN